MMKRFRQKEPAPGTPESCDRPERKAEDLLKEVQSVLRLHRWEVREKLFQGFGSQSDRF
jgi:hypothetical protein